MEKLRNLRKWQSWRWKQWQIMSLTGPDQVLTVTNSSSLNWLPRQIKPSFGKETTKSVQTVKFTFGNRGGSGFHDSLILLSRHQENTDPVPDTWELLPGRWLHLPALQPRPEQHQPCTEWDSRTTQPRECGNCCSIFLLQAQINSILCAPLHFLLHSMAPCAVCWTVRKTPCSNSRRNTCFSNTNPSPLAHYLTNIPAKKCLKI